MVKEECFEISQKVIAMVEMWPGRSWGD